MRKEAAPALATPNDVIALANSFRKLADNLHRTLRRLTSQPDGDNALAYGLLTEEYALRARTNMLLNDASQHTIEGLNFSQASLMRALTLLADALLKASTLEATRSIASDLITFATAINPGKARIVNFLAKEVGV